MASSLGRRIFHSTRDAVGLPPCRHAALVPDGTILSMTGVVRRHRGLRHSVDFGGNSFYASLQKVGREASELQRRPRWRCGTALARPPPRHQDFLGFLPVSEATMGVKKLCL